MPKLVVERISREQLRAELEELERERGITSGTFLDHWIQGQFDDPQSAWWAALCHMAIQAEILERPASVPSAFPEAPGAVAI